MSNTGQSAEQQTLAMIDEDVPTKTESITLTVRAKLQTSKRKRQLLRDRVADWQRILKFAGETMPSLDHFAWGANSTPISHIVKNEFAYPKEADEGDRTTTIPRHTAYQAGYKVGEAFSSWHERGQDGEYPSGDWGNGDFIRFCGCCHSQEDCFVSHGNGRYGLKIKHATTGTYQANETEWLGIDAPSAYQRERLDAIVNGEASMGSFEIRMGNPCWVHIPVTTDVEVYKVGSVDRWMGVDMGESNVYAAVVVEDDETVRTTDDGPQVHIESGGEFRDRRNRISERRDALQEKGQLRKVKEAKKLRRDYTDQMTHIYACDIVDLAVENAPIEIVLEDLTGYRQNAQDPIHDWPHFDLKEKIAYKATQAGIPVKTDADPAGTSTTCPKCGDRDPSKRINRDEFYCRRCDYGPLNSDYIGGLNLALGRM